MITYPESFANQASTTLSAAVASGDATIQVAALPAGVTWPSNAGGAVFRIVVDMGGSLEYMLVTAGGGGGAATTLTVTRAMEGTFAVPHGTGAPVGHVVTAAALAQLEAQGAISVKSGFGAVGDGVTNDAAAFQAAMNALAGTGVALFIPALTFVIGTALAVPSNLRIVGSPGAVLKSTLTTATGNPLNAIFKHAAVETTTTTLSSNATLGLNTISTAASVPAGTYVRINEQGSSGFRCALYLVKAVSGVGPYTLTLDRPVRYTFKSADVVTYVTPLVGFVLDGNGMTIAGTGDRYIELFEAWGCVVRDVNFGDGSGSVSDSIMSFDNPSFGCRAERLTADCANLASLGFRFESCEDCTYRECVVKRVAGTGFLIGDSVNCHLYGCSAYQCTGNGANFTGNTGATATKEGSDSCTLVGGSYSGNGVGVYFDGGTNRCKAIGATIYGNTTDGVQFDASTTQTQSDNAIVGCDIQRNGASNSGVSLAGSALNTTIAHCVFIGGQVGVNVSVNSKGTRCFDLDFNGQQIGIQGNSDFIAVGLTGTVTANIIYCNNAASNGRVSNVTATGGANYAFQLNSGSLWLTNIYLTLVANCTAFLNNGGTGYLSNFALGGSGGGSQGIFANAGTTRLGLGIDVTAAATPFPSGAGVLTLAQGQGQFAGVVTTGTEVLTQVQATAEEIRSTVTLTGNVTEQVPAGIKGIRYVAFNGTSGAFTWSVGVVGGTAIAVAAGKRAILISDGTNMLRVTPDT